MNTIKRTTFIALPIAAALALAGCASPSIVAAPSSSAPAPTATTSPSATPTSTASAGAEPSAAGDVAAPGTKTGIGVPLVYSFTSTDKVSVLISAKLLDVTPATADQTAFLNTQFKDGQLNGYQLSLIHLEMTRVSGAPVKYNDDSTSFKPVDAAGKKIQDVTLIGWDECGTESFTDEFDAGAPITQCYVAAVPAGGNAAAGLMYDGGFTDPNPYSDYEGKPLLFLSN